MPEIDTDKVYKQLKKQNGEAAARIIRDAVLLDVPNIVHILEFAGNNPDEIQQLVPIIREIYKTQKQSEFQTDKGPLELLSDAGYDAFVVKTEEQKNSIKKYFRKNEELCTFRDPTRLGKYYMIHAIKRGVEKIKHAKNPERDDEYGTSVISIQIAKSGGFISIKNRYNHTVKDPDNTFDSNPDKIIPGLANSLKKYFNVEFNVFNAPIPRHFRMVNDQLVRFDREIENIYLSSDYYFSGSTITKINPDNQVLFDCGFLLTISRGNNSVVYVGNYKNFKENVKYFDEFLRDKKIKITVAPDKTKQIYANDEHFMDVNKDGIITFLHAPNFERLNLRYAQLAGDLDFSGVRTLDLEHADLTNVHDIKFNPNADYINLRDTKLHGDLDFSGVRSLNLTHADLTNVHDIKFNPNAEYIHLSDTKLHGDLDFSGVRRLNLEHADLTDVHDIKFNPNADYINLRGTKTKLHGDLDFSGVILLNLERADLTDVHDIKFNPNADEINLINTKLHGDLDFSGVQSLNIEYADLTDVRDIKFNPERFHKNAGLIGTKLSGDWDFGNAADLYLRDTDLTRVRRIKFNPNAHTIDLAGATLGGDLDFSGVRRLNLMHADLTGVRSIKLKSNEYVNLKVAKLSGDWDFSTVKAVDLNDADLTDVHEIKFNPNTDIDLRGAKLSGDLDFSDREYIDIRNADLTRVRSIKLNPQLYKKIKKHYVTIKYDNTVVEMPLFAVQKHGITLENKNAFKIATNKIKELGIRKTLSNMMGKIANKTNN